MSRSSDSRGGPRVPPPVHNRAEPPGRQNRNKTGRQRDPASKPGRAVKEEIRLRAELTCLHCWSKFVPEDLLWLSEHRDLIGDPLLGDQSQLRFLANRFDVHGNAIDARGEICRDIACPHCHLVATTIGS